MESKELIDMNMDEVANEIIKLAKQTKYRVENLTLVLRKGVSP